MAFQNATADPAVLPKLKNLLGMLTQKECVRSDIKKLKLNSKPWEWCRQNFGKIFTRLCRDCLCAHRFEAAGRLMEIICKEQNSIDHFIFMAGLQVLENHPHASEKDFLKFIHHIQYLKNLNKREVLLELMMFVLRRNLSSAYSDVKTIHGRLKTRVLRRNDVIDPLSKGYLALFDYINWVKNCKEGNSDLNKEEINESTKKIISAFQEIIECPGQNDIFVIKLVEMLEYYEQYEQAENILVKYVEMNATHINSYMYLCAYLRKHNADSDKLIKYLKKLAKLNPSDPFVLVLVEELKGRPHANEKSLRLLFGFLDCPAQTNNLKAWKKLSKLMFHVLKYPVPTETSVMNSCWDNIRVSFWNSFHFCVKTLQLNDVYSAKVSVQKAIFLSVIEDSHPYVQAVADQLPGVSDTLFSKLQKKLATIEDLKSDFNEQNYSSDNMDVS